jgi:hypothetical protein
MDSTLKRRSFIIKSSRAGMACCCFLLCPAIAAPGRSPDREDDEKPDPAKLNYCGYVCPEDCVFLKGTLENDVVLKKQAYEQWSIKERFGIDFEADRIFCYGCKAPGKPDGVILQNCTVRKCTIDKGYECCIECPDLAGCDKDLWTRFPDFRAYVIDLQKKYLAE